MSKTKVIITSVVSVWLCLLLVVFTYSWVARNLTPSISQDDLKISSAGALVISVMGDDNVNEVDLNKLANLDSFVFKQVSSLNGQNFMWLDFRPTLEGQEAVYRKDASTDNYIDTKFALKLDDSLADGKYVYLHEDCFLEDYSESLDVAKAIRIAVDFTVLDADGNNKTVTYILGNTKDNALIDMNTNAVDPYADGKSISDTSATAQQTIYNFDYFDGSDEKKCLFKLEPGEMKWVNLRIWLEGADENCANEIAGESFRMNLKFDSKTSLS